MTSNPIEEAIEAFPHAKIDEAALEYRERVLDWFEDHCQTIEDTLTALSTIKDTHVIIAKKDLPEDYAETLATDFASDNDSDDYPFNGEEYDIKLVTFFAEWLIFNYRIVPKEVTALVAEQLEPKCTEEG